MSAEEERHCWGSWVGRGETWKVSVALFDLLSPPIFIYSAPRRGERERTSCKIREQLAGCDSLAQKARLHSLGS